VGPDVPSWEEIINRVTIASNYYNVEASGQQYQTAFSNIDQLHQSLTRLIDESDSWKGSAADSFRAHIRKIADGVNDLANNHRRIKDGMAGCAQYLKTAVDTIPVPGWMYDDIADKQRAYHDTGEVYLYPTGDFRNTYISVVENTMSHIPLLGDAMKWLDGWINDREGEAQRAYSALTGNLGGEYPNVPEGRRSDQFTGVSSGTDFNPSGTGPGGGAGGGPGSGGGFDPNKVGSGPNGSFAPPNTGDSGPTTNPGADFNDPSLFTPTTQLQSDPSLPGGGFGGGGGGGGFGGGGGNRRRSEPRW